MTRRSGERGSTGRGAGRILGADGRSKAYRPLPETQRRAAREAGIAAYGAGRFWHAHEHLEPAWMGSADPAERDLDQGLIKLAAAYVHAERGNLAGMRKNLVGAAARLRAVVDAPGARGSDAAERAGVDVPLVLRDVEEALARLDELSVAAGSHRGADVAAGSHRGADLDADLDKGLLALVPPTPIARLGRG